MQGKGYTMRACFAGGMGRGVWALIGAVVLSIPSVAAGEEPSPSVKDPFPPSSEVKPPIRMDRDAVVTVDKDGNYVVNGKIRFLVGAQLGEGGLKNEYLPTPGYDASLKWLYEDVPDYERAQRVGLDSLSFFTNESWIRSSGIVKDFTDMRTVPEEDAWLDRFIADSKLPLYVDYSCMPYWHGLLATKPYLEKKAIPLEALNVGGYEKEANHWVPYSVTHPEGRKLYRLMWEDGARRVLAKGGKALFYELFNEPAYDDPSDYNRALFAERMKAKYGGIEKLNKDWRSDYKSFEDIAKFKNRSDTPGLYVEWCKFMEDSFVDNCAEGVKAIKAVDTRPETLFCVQVLGGENYRVIPPTNVNLFKLSKILNCGSSCTGGGIVGAGMTVEPVHAIDATIDQRLVEGVAHRHFLRAINDGKPIHDGEAYIGTTRKSLMSALWLQLARGGNAAYLFHWSKRGWDRAWPTPDTSGTPAVEGRTAAGGRRVAELFPYKFLNPYAMKTEELLGTLDFKRELYKVDDIFVPRQNRPKADVAVLLSYPTERYSQAAGNPAHNEILGYTAALEFSHYPIDVLPEEMIVEGKLSNYKVLVAAGVENVYPESVPGIRSFVENGGTLVLGGEAMTLDEHGNPVDWSGMLDLGVGAKVKSSPLGNVTLTFPQAAEIPGAIHAKEYRTATPGPEWKAVGSIGEKNVMFRKSVGKGCVYWLNCRMPEYAAAAVLGGIMRPMGIVPTCDVVNVSNNELAANVETHRRVAGAFAGYFLYNWDKFPKLVRFSCAELRAGQTACLPLDGAAPAASDGWVTLCLPPADKVVVVCGPAGELEKRFGKLQGVDAVAVKAVYGKLKTATAAAEGAAEKGKAFTFPVDESKCVPLNMKNVANRHFEDSVAGDGKGGWTDQGENSLRGVEWGRQNYCGVPFDIIRWDENAGNACIVLASKNMRGVPEKVSGIPVGEKVKAIYFLHATAWTKGGEAAMNYVLNHPDGSTTTIPVKCGEGVGDWWLGNETNNANKGCKVAWRNSENKGFYAWRWQNPTPEKMVDTIDIVSANGDPIPVVIGITIERTP